VTLIGDLPRGLPPLTLPTVDWDVLPTLLGGAVAVALVSFADTGALSTATALQAGQRVDPDDEIRALGVSNLLSGLFQGFATSASSSRTAVAMAVGARTQVAGLVAAGGVLVIVVAAPGLVARMPEPTLAAIVIAASLALFDLRGWRWLAAVRRSELFLSLATTAGVLLFGVLEGLGVAIGLAIANFVRRAWRPHATELGIVPGVSGYHDLTRHPEADLVPGLLLLRFDAPLFFANAAEFGRWLEGWLHDTDRPIERVVVVANAMTDVDSTGAEILTEVLDDLDRRGVAFAFAGLKGVVRDRLARYGLVERIGMDAFFPNTISAVEAHTAARDARDAGGADGDTDDRQDGQD
jgi:MFS superfamily sulfate permease-like transporter